MSVSSGIAFPHRLAVRQAIPIFVGLLVLLAASLTFGYLYARDAILDASGARVRQISGVAGTASVRFLQRAEQRMEGIVRCLERAGPEETAAMLATGPSALGRLVAAGFAGENSWKELAVSIVDEHGRTRSAVWPRAAGNGPAPGLPAVFGDAARILSGQAGQDNGIAGGARACWVPSVPADGNGEETLMRRTVVLMRTDNGAPRPFGAVSLTVSMSWLASFVDGVAGIRDMRSLVLPARDVPPNVRKTAVRDNAALFDRGARAGDSGESARPVNEKHRVAVFVPLAPTGFFLSVLIPEKALFGPLNRLTRMLFLLALAALAPAVWSLHATTKGMLRPLEYLTAMAERLSQGDFAPGGGAAGKTQPAHPRPRAGGDEPGRLMRAADSLRLALKQRAEDLTLAASARERILGELALARAIQEGIRPGEMPRAANLDAAAHLHVAQAVCGDMYDAFFRSPHELCCVLSDVAARGVPASLLMGRVMPLLHETLLSGMAPGMALETVNRTLSIGGKDRAVTDFVGVIAGVLDIRTGLFTWAGAGQPPPLHCSAASVTELPWSENMPLGIRRDARYRDLEVRLRAGDGLFLASDGLCTARSGEGLLYGESRLAATLRSFAPGGRADCEALLRAVRDDVLAHTAPDGPQDDIAMLAVYWRGPLRESGPGGAPS